MTINMKNIIKGLAVAVCFSAMLTSCTKNFEYFNTNQYEATDELMDRDNLRTGAFFNQMQRVVIIYADGTLLDSDYQVCYNLLADSYAGYLAPTGSWNNGVHTGSYFMTPGWARSLFSRKYETAMNAWVELNLNATAQGDVPQIVALGNILKVANMHQVTDYYGPIPYSEVGTTLNAAYDAQEDIYKKFFEELGSAIDVLNDYKNGNPGVPVLADYDYVYGGDVTKWIKFANSLRLRLAMRVAYADPALAQAEAEKSVNDQTGLMTEASDWAGINKAYTNYVHPIQQCNAFNHGETQMGASMDSYLNGYKDPRLAKFFKVAGDGSYHGVRNGIVGSTWSKYGNAEGNVSAPNLGSANISWMNASEVYFLLAEGALRGWNMGGTPQEFYEKGIRTSFDENGVSGADTYLANTTAKPADFVDNTNSGNGTSAPSTVTIAWDEAADDEAKLEKIMTQKWIALFPNGCEAWAEYRRTGYPKLLPVVVNSSEGAVSSELQIRRVTFPYDEYENNAAAVMGGVSKLGGQDNVGTKLWWDKKPR